MGKVKQNGVSFRKPTTQGWPIYVVGERIEERRKGGEKRNDFRAQSTLMVEEMGGDIGFIPKWESQGPEKETWKCLCVTAVISKFYLNQSYIRKEGCPTSTTLNSNITLCLYCGVQRLARE